MRNKKLLTTLGAVTLIGAIGLGSTLAYLTATTNEVKNTFTMGNVKFNEDLDNGLLEKPVEREDNGTGAYVFSTDTTDGSDWVTENTYEDLVPGETVPKNPTIFMAADSEDAWLFVLISNYNDAAFDEIKMGDNWVDVTDDYTTAGNTVADSDRVFAYNTKVTKADTDDDIVEVFSEVTIADDIEVPEVEEGATEVESPIPDLTIKAFAIQALGFDSYTDAISEVSFE